MLSSAEFPAHDLTFEYPIFKTMFEVTHLPQVPSIQFWRMSGGSTSERGADSIPPPHTHTFVASRISMGT